MKIQKMSFKDIKDVLTREEMKKIMAGSGGSCGNCTVQGYTNVACYSGSGDSQCPCLCLYRGTGCGC